MPDPFLTSDLKAAYQQPGCPVCRLAHASVQRYVQSIFYGRVNDVPLRAQLRTSLGFCQEHARLALQPGMGDALGLSIIYHDIVTNVMRDLQEPGARSKRGSRLGTWLQGAGQSAADLARTLAEIVRPRQPCPVCQERERSTRLILENLLESMTQPDQVLLYAASEGLCLPHLRQAFLASTTADVLEQLVNKALARLSTIDAELAEFIRKNDYRFGAEEPGPEKDAWQRVIALVVGDRPPTQG